MNFREATDVLFAQIKQEELAKSLGVSVQTIYQARADEKSKGYRSPPANWEKAVVKLADQHAKQLSGLGEKLRSQKG